MVNHYRQFFLIAIPVVLPGAPVFVFSQQDQADMIAFLKLL